MPTGGVGGGVKSGVRCEVRCGLGIDNSKKKKVGKSLNVWVQVHPSQSQQYFFDVMNRE